MKTGVLGSGDVAKALAAGLASHGHQVKIGSRTPAKLASWVGENPGISSGTFAEAAEFGEMVVLAVKGTVAAEALELAGAKNLNGKTVMDACNPIEDSPPEKGVLRFFTDINDSLMERLQRQFTGARFVKAYNSVGSGLMVNPELQGGRPTMFICGNDPSAKEQVTQINEQFGWDTADMGGAEAARAIEPLCMLWCLPGFLRNDWVHAFKVLTK
ncbi:MAG TPA: NAD(P)-binding domain-containing protein [Terracidiphilus sp.]|jgi:predicted dinucleotide-binding enzyme|nr:NAD(P)-binding domain-containing protein [Terracidiphilus sp.]